MGDIDIFYITDDGVLKKVGDVPKLQYPRADFLMFQYGSAIEIYITAGTTLDGLVTIDKSEIYAFTTNDENLEFR